MSLDTWRPSILLELNGAGPSSEASVLWETASRGLVTTVQGSYFCVSGTGVLTMFLGGNPVFQFLTDQVSTPAVIVSVPLWIPVDANTTLAFVYESEFYTDVLSVIATGWTIPV